MIDRPTPPVPPTPRTLAQRASGPRRRLTDNWKKTLAIGALGLASTVVSGYYSGITAVGDRDRSMGERVAAVEVAQAEQYKALLELINQGDRNAHRRAEEIRGDLNAIRAEIMNILKERR